MEKPNVSLNSLPPALEPKGRKTNSFFKRLVQQRTLAWMCLPFVIWAFIFKYLPLWGWTMAFQNFKPAILLGSTVGRLAPFPYII